MPKLIDMRQIDLENKTVFIRCDFNVPLDANANITDDRRIVESLETIRFCLDKNCKVILASHLGRPKGEGFEADFSLAPVQRQLQSLLDLPVKLSSNVAQEGVREEINELKKGEVLLLENLRFDKREKKGDQGFAKALANLAQVYINNAFGVSHRSDASVCAITDCFDDLHKGAGLLLQKEIEFFGASLSDAKTPFAAVIGGSKVSGKLEALLALLPKVDKLLIGGGMAFTFLKAQGYEVGKSLVEDDLLDEAKRVLQLSRDHGVELLLPVDVVMADRFDADATVREVAIDAMEKEWMGLDIGQKTLELFQKALQDCKTILWNGPMGVFEMEAFCKGSFELSHYIASLDAVSIVGGGDTANVVLNADDVEKMTFISTGGGASLELLEGKSLPAVEKLLR